MTKISREDFSYLGAEYQYKLILQLLTDRKFANSIIDIIDPNYFKDQSLRVIVLTIKEAKENFDTIIDIQGLEYRILEKIPNELERRVFISELRRIEASNLNDTPYVQDSALKFCKRQELKKSLTKITKIIETGDIDAYDECEKILREGLDHGPKPKSFLKALLSNIFFSIGFFSGFLVIFFLL